MTVALSTLWNAALETQEHFHNDTVSDLKFFAIQKNHDAMLRTFLYKVQSNTNSDIHVSYYMYILLTSGLTPRSLHARLQTAFEHGCKHESRNHL